MKEKSTQILLGAIAALLVVHLFLSPPLLTVAHAREETVSTVLRARTIELVDESGRARVNLRTEKDGAVVFRMMDSKGTIRVKLGASESGSGLLLFDETTEPGVHLLATRDETKVSLARKGKEPRVIQP